MTDSDDTPTLAAIHEQSGSIILVIDPEDEKFFAEQPGYVLRLATPDDEREIANSVRY